MYQRDLGERRDELLRRKGAAEVVGTASFDVSGAGMCAGQRGQNLPAQVADLAIRCSGGSVDVHPAAADPFEFRHDRGRGGGWRRGDGFGPAVDRAQHPGVRTGVLQGVQVVVHRLDASSAGSSTMGIHDLSRCDRWGGRDCRAAEPGVFQLGVCEAARLRHLDTVSATFSSTNGADVRGAFRAPGRSGTAAARSGR
jgi:hypothetical protein